MLIFLKNVFKNVCMFMCMYLWGLLFAKEGPLFLPCESQGSNLGHQAWR